MAVQTGMERLQKIIANAGVTSRRKAEALILEGRVTVNGHVVRELGSRADVRRSVICVDGKRLSAHLPKVYLLLYKPKGCVTTLSDPQGRATVMHLLKGVRLRVFPVGRLDYDTEGLLLFTNDGELAHALMHPRYEIEKTYQVKIKGVLEDGEIRQLERGIRLPTGTTAPCRIRKLKKTSQNSWLEITLHEGKKRQVRLMLERTGHPVLKLIRVRYAFLGLDDLTAGQYRHLLPQEVKRLKALTRTSRRPSP